MKKERLFFLDFIRAFATIIIVITHYNVPYYGVPQRINDVITVQVGGINIGSFGVSLFLIISSAALSYVYRDSLHLKSFFKKRLQTIYPMFWTAFLLAFLFMFLKTKQLHPAIPKINIIWSILGADQYGANFSVLTFAIVGEWFTGFILIFYLVFPLLRFLVLKYPKATAVGGLLFYALILIINTGSIGKSILLPTRILELLFGMYYIFYFYKKKIPMPIFVMALLVVVGNTILVLPVNQDIATTIIGICTFLVLVKLSYTLDIQPIRIVCNFLVKYSYAIFLTHHFIIIRVLETFELTLLTRLENYILFTACLVIILLISVALHHLTNQIILFVQTMFTKKKSLTKRKVL